jgi:hypothetical protein
VSRSVPAAAETGYLRFKRITDAIQSKKLTKQLAEKEDLVSVAEARVALAQAEANRVDILPGLRKAVLDAGGK